MESVFSQLAGQMADIETAIQERRVISSSKVPRKDGHGTRFEDITIFPLVANGVEGAVIRVDDVTEHVRLDWSHRTISRSLSTKPSNWRLRITI